MSRVDRTDYELALLQWLKAVLPTAYKVIFENADGPRPKGKYATLLVTPFTTDGQADILVLDIPIGSKFTGTSQTHHQSTCSVNLYGSDSRQRMEEVKASIFLPDVLELTGASGLSITAAEATVELTGIEGTRSVPRYQCDFTFTWSLLTTYDADVIETVFTPEI